ncbi:MAG: hypothetical protein JWL71_666 [Acidobacteria bacterium]|nr:hypothetical protein [Acidobacteriota bacterium]
MKSIWQEDARRELSDRIGALRWDRRAAWGRFTAPQMICHLAESLKMAMGELMIRPKRSPIRYAPLKQLIIYVAPFPKGAPTAPELLAREPGDFAADVADVQRLLARAASARTTERWPEHPAFGTLSTRAWGVLIYRHMDHHLRQFAG